MKKILLYSSIALVSIIGLISYNVAHAALVFGDGNIGTLDQFTSTSSPYAITQRVFGKPLLLTGLTPNKCLRTASNGMATTSASDCGAGGSGSSTPGGASSTIQFNANGTFAGNNYFTFDGQQVTIGTSTGGDLWIPGNGSVSTAAGGIFMGPIKNVELHVSDLSDLWLSTNKNGGNGRIVLDTDSLDLNNAVIDTTNGGAFFGPIYMSSDNGVNLDLGYNRYAALLSSRYMRPRNAFIGSHLSVATTSSTTNQFTVEGDSFMTGNLTAANITATGTLKLSSITNSRYLATDLNSNVIATNTPVVPSNFSAKGDILAGTGASAYSALTVGGNGTLLMASSTATNGLAWVATSSLGISGGSGTPAGASSTVQFNANGTFAGDSKLTYDGYSLKIAASSTSANPFFRADATTSIPILAAIQDSNVTSRVLFYVPDRSNAVSGIEAKHDSEAAFDAGNALHYFVNTGTNNSTGNGGGRFYFEGRRTDGLLSTGNNRPTMNFGGIRAFEGLPPRMIQTDQVDASYCKTTCSVIGNGTSNLAISLGNGGYITGIDDISGNSGQGSLAFQSNASTLTANNGGFDSNFIFKQGTSTNLLANNMIWTNQANTKLMVLSSGGNLGIGSSTPSTKLVVNGTATIANLISTSTATSSSFAGKLGIGSSTPSTALVVNGTTTTTNLNATGTVQFTALGSTGSPCLTIGTTGLVATSTCGAGSGTVNSGTTGQVAYYAANGTAVSGSSTLFLTNQNVGIGTTNPLRPLHVFGPVDTSGVALFESSIIGSGQFAVANFQLDTPSNPINGDGPRIDFRTSNTTGVLGNRIASISAVNSNNSTTTGDLRFLTVNNGGFVNTMTMTYAGNVGIGTSTPGTNLFVNGSYGSKVSRIIASTTLDTTYNTVVVDATAGALTVTLPSASSTCGIIYNIKKVDAGTSTITIAAASSQRIDGASSVLVYNQYTNYGLQADCTAAPYGWITLYP